MAAKKKTDAKPKKPSSADAALEVDRLVDAARQQGQTHVQVDTGGFSKNFVSTLGSRSVQVPVDQAGDFVRSSPSRTVRVTSRGGDDFSSLTLRPPGNRSALNPDDPTGGRVLDSSVSTPRRGPDRVVPHPGDVSVAEAKDKEHVRDRSKVLEQGLIPELPKSAQTYNEALSQTFDTLSEQHGPEQANEMVRRTMNLLRQYDPDYRQAMEEAGQQYQERAEFVGRPTGSGVRTKRGPANNSFVFSRENSVPGNPEDARLWSSRSLARGIAAGGEEGLRHMSRAERYAGLEITPAQVRETPEVTPPDGITMAPEGVRRDLSKVVGQDPKAEQEARMRFLVRHSNLYGPLMDSESDVGTALVRRARGAGVKGLVATGPRKSSLQKIDEQTSRTIEEKDAATVPDPWDQRNQIGVRPEDTSDSASFPVRSNRGLVRSDAERVREQVRAELLDHIRAKHAGTVSSANDPAESAIGSAQAAIARRGQKMSDIVTFPGVAGVEDVGKAAWFGGDDRFSGGQYPHSDLHTQREYRGTAGEFDRKAANRSAVARETQKKKKGLGYSDPVAPEELI